MSWLDAVLFGLVAVSVLISLVRGFLRECLSIVTWVAAVWAGVSLAPRTGPWLEAWVESPTLRMAIAFAVLFVAVLVIGGIAGYLAGKLVSGSGLSGTDRMLGVVFGVARGVLIVAALILVAGLTTLPREPWWRASLVTAWATPRLCAIDVEEWLADADGDVPLAGGTARFEGAAERWADFCASVPPQGGAERELAMTAGNRSGNRGMG